MVPTPIIMLVLLVAFGPGAVAYLCCWPKRRLANPFFAVLAGDVALMLVTLMLEVVDVQFVWLSWVLLAAAILMVPLSVTMCRRGLAISRQKQREVTERRMRGG
jgi:hypothetical protein